MFLYLLVRSLKCGDELVLTRHRL